MVRPLRVVFSLDSLGLGGTEMNALRVAERLDKSRFELTIACFRDDGKLRDRFAATGARILVFPLTSLYGPSAIRSGWDFYRFLRREQIDVVHAHDRYANIFAMPWASLARTKAKIASKRWNAMSRVHAVGNRMAYKLADRVLGNSTRVGESLIADDGVPRRKVVVVTNFVSEETFAAPDLAWRQEARSALGLTDIMLAIGIVANLRAIKDHRTLLRAFGRIAHRDGRLRLVIMGDGSERGALESQARELSIESQVIFAGTYPNHPNPHALFDISALTSISEGFPNSIVEAMAAHRPVVATDTGGVSDAVIEGETGVLVPVGDDAALARAFTTLLDDSARRTRMGDRAAIVARERFSEAHVMAQIEQLYLDLTSR